MRPVCLGPLTDFQAMDSLETTCVMRADHSIRRPSMSANHRERLPHCSTLLMNRIDCGSSSRLNKEEKTVCTGQPMLMLFSSRRTRRATLEDRDLHDKLAPIPNSVPAAAPAAKPGQKSSRGTLVFGERLKAGTQ